MDLKELIPALCLGLALSACCGFRVFVPLLVTGLAAKFDFIPLSAGSEWIASYPAIAAFAAACMVEITAYYFPVIDNLLDSIAIPSSVVAGSIVAASVFTDFDPLVKWGVAIIAGGGAAGLIQTGTSLARLGSTKFTAGTGNFVLATAENLFSFVGSIFSLLIPVMMFIIFGALIAGSIYLIAKRNSRQE